MKTYLELEEMIIIGMYIYNDHLRIITKGGNLWEYHSDIKKFQYLHTL